MKRQEYREKYKYPETSTFKYLNVNPKNRITDDCFVRSISYAFDKDYYEVYKELFEISLKTGYSVNARKVIERYMKDKGIDKQNQPKHSDGTKYTGKQFAETFCDGTYICSIGGHHVSVCRDGKFYDIWDCTDKCIGNFYKVR